MNVGELKRALSRYDDELPVVATWEGTLEHISVYMGTDCVIVDADNDYYRTHFEGKLSVYRGGTVDLTVTRSKP